MQSNGLGPRGCTMPFVRPTFHRTVRHLTVRRRQRRLSATSDKRVLYSNCFAPKGISVSSKRSWWLWGSVFVASKGADTTIYICINRNQWLATNVANPSYTKRGALNLTSLRPILGHRLSGSYILSDDRPDHRRGLGWLAYSKPSNGRSG
jgi:hypothetical protein